MAKNTNVIKLSKKEQDELFAEFAKTLASFKNPIEAANLIRDIYSEQEALMLARRLKVAELLNENFTYAQIRKALKISDGTIARVQTWLRLYGDGCRLLFKRTKKHRPETKGYPSWPSLKKKYPVYFWPELLLEEIIRSASKRRKEKLLNVIQGMREKTKLTKQLMVLLS